MQDIFNNRLLDDLYEIRGVGFDTRYTKKYGKTKESKEVDKQEKKFEEILKEKIKNENDFKEALNQLNNLQLAMMAECCFWYNKFYKLGYTDGMNFVEEIKNEMDKNSNINNSNIYRNFDDIMELIKDENFKN